jgi:subtilase family serine protease
MSAPATDTAAVRVVLGPRGGVSALERAVAAVSTPGKRRDRKFLTQAQFRARYEPTVTTVNAVEQSLRAEGFEIISVEPRRRWIVARGHSAVRLPRNLARDVIGVVAVKAAPGTVESLPRIDADVGAGPYQVTRPCSRYYGQVPARVEADGKTPLPKFRRTRPAYRVCGYGPRQLRLAYEGRTKLTGRGVTVAVVDPFASTTMRRDADRYAITHGDRPFTRGQYNERLPRSFDLTDSSGLCDPPTSYELEESLDVEAVHAMAPDAKVRYYAAPRCDDPNDPGTVAALDRVVDENRASIVSDSYGNPDSLNGPGVRAEYEQAFLQAAMQGITVLFSTGDFGGVVQYPSSDPWVTAVGGTSAAIDSRNRLMFQAGWESDQYQLSPNGTTWANPTAYAGGGGGFSKLFPRPSWQAGVVPSGDARGRAVPDLAMDGNPSTGMAVGETQRFPNGVRYGLLRVGGTSLATPLMAGIEALAVQSAGGRLGWINPAIYREARRGARTFTDIRAKYDSRALVAVGYTDPLDASAGVSYTLQTLGDSSGFERKLVAGTGWDPATGLGTPNPRYFISQGR